MNTNKTNMKELNINEMEQVSGGGWKNMLLNGIGAGILTGGTGACIGAAACAPAPVIGPIAGFVVGGIGGFFVGFVPAAIEGATIADD